MKPEHRLLFIIALSCFLIILINVCNFQMVEKLNQVIGLVSGQVGIKVTMDTEKPEIISCLAAPKIVLVNETINFAFEVTDNDRLLDTYIIITLPDFTNITIINNNYKSDITGEFVFYCIANDYRHNEGSQENKFIVSNSLDFIVSVPDKNNISTNITFYYPNSTIEVMSFAEIDNFSAILPDSNFDVEFYKADKKIKTVLAGVNLSKNNDKFFREEIMEIPLEGFDLNYVIETDYEFESSTIDFDYSELDLAAGIDLDVWVCHNWDLAGENCLGDWELSNSVQNKDEQIVTLIVTEFSGFGLKESLPAIEITPSVSSARELAATPGGGMMIKEKSDVPEVKIADEMVKPMVERPTFILEIRKKLAKAVSLEGIFILLILIIILETLNYWNFMRNSKRRD